MRKSIVAVCSLLLLLEGCGTATPSATDGGTSAKQTTVESYDKVVGVSPDQVTELYVGYHIGPKGTWEFNTKDSKEIHMVIRFLKNQQFTNLGKIPLPKTTGDFTNNKISFSTNNRNAKSVDMSFFEKDNVEVLTVNNTLYSISATRSEEDKLFQDLKQNNKK